MLKPPFSGQANPFISLSLKDLFEARDAYHLHLMSHPHVVATALGRYRIRRAESWPGPDGKPERKGEGPRTLANSEVRSYSWPAVLVFVEEWVDPGEFAKGKRFTPDQILPRMLFLPDGRKIPVCVIQVDPILKTSPTPPIRSFPLNNLGGGLPILAKVQGRDHVATAACLVSDGHRIYALTNRHVAGDPGETLYSILGGREVPIGQSSGRQLSRLPFTEVHREWPARNAFLNLDAGLIDIDDLKDWTARVRDLGLLGRMADLSPTTATLSIIGQHVIGMGAVSGRMEGEISAVLFRYKAVGGFEYISDFLIGPASAAPNTNSQGLLTRPGDSGALWTVPSSPSQSKEQNAEYHPFAVQWGAQLFDEQGPTSYALATSLPTICRLLDLDLVRDWNLDQTDTWGSIGHFSIAASVAACLTDPVLKPIMEANAAIISPPVDDILSSEFKGMGTDDFVPLADVPDMFWKPRIAKQGAARAMEGPNHFADMDQPRPEDGKTLLDLSEDPDFLDPEQWNAFYDSVEDLLSHEPIAPAHRGLLPFRVWQIFNEMTRFAREGKVAEFVCAAGVLTHYIGDACQPLHISYLHDGDPEQPQSKTVNHRDGTSEEKVIPLGQGIHAAYEDAMVNAHRQEILDALASTPKVKAKDLVKDGRTAGLATIALMRKVFGRLPPRDIVDFYIQYKTKPKQTAEDLWTQFGEDTKACMKDGVHLLAALWQGAWTNGRGNMDGTRVSKKAITQEKAMEVCRDKDFLPSMPITRIKRVLK